MTPSTPPKGSLEDLFRHHLLESEAAAVPPRPQVWEQLDNTLLLAQNEKYRHRLAAYRWAVAASLLLASLAGGGWWHSQQQTATATLARATPQVADRPGLVTARRAAATAPLASPASVSAADKAQVATASSTPLPSSAIDQTITLLASHASLPTAASTRILPRHFRQATSAQFTPLGVANSSVAASSSGRSLASREQAAPSATAQQAVSQVEETLASPSLSASGLAVATPGLSGAGNSALATSLVPADELEVAAATSQSPALASAAPVAGEASLDPRWASLTNVPASGLPASLAPVPVATGPPLELARHWQYGASYAASAFQPNIDFSKAAESYNTALGLNSPIVTRSAAAEYRNNLRAGLGQRLSLWATRRLGASRWGLRTGLELTQSTASSASSVAFVGEQVADLAYSQASFAAAPTPARLQSTSYRYRSVSVPVEARYSNPAKTGFSFYGRMGAFVSALLNVRSEVEDNPEAARTYTLNSVSSPYRHLSVGLRGGGGVQYRPARHQWAFNLGPVAELGVLSLNANPSQDFLTQQRPYSFGLEAGVELGRGFKIQ